MRKLFAILLTFCMVFSFVSFAGADEVTITFAFWDNNQEPGMTAIAEAYMAAHPDVKVEVQVTPWNEYWTKLEASAMGGSMPDVFWMHSNQFFKYVTANTLLPMDFEYDYSPYPAGVTALYTYNDVHYAVPKDYDTIALVYNKEIFEEAGAEVPATYDELLDTCQKIKDAGYTPITISAGTAWCLSMLAGYLCDREGVDLPAINSGEESWVQDKTIAAGEKLLELSQYFQETAAGDSNDDATMAFAMGDAAILIQGSWAIGQMNAYNPDIEEKCGVFQFPAIEGGGDPGRTIAKSDSLAVSATSKCPEGAVELIKYFTDDEAQKYTAEVGGKIPVTKVEFDLEVAPAQLADVMDVFSNATGTFGFYNESLVSSDAGSEFDNEMVAIFQQEKTPEEAFQAVEDWYAEEGYR